MPRRSPSRRARSVPAKTPPVDTRWTPADTRWTSISIHLLLAALCLLVVPGAYDPFDQPKLLAAEVLALASLVPLAWRWNRPDLRRLWELPAVRAVTPLLMVATLGLFWSEHPAATREALASLWVGAAVLVGWSVGLPPEHQRSLLTAVAGWGGVAALLSLLQATGVYRPLLYAGGEEAGRLGTGALVGNPGVLAGWLVLAAVIAGDGMVRAWRERQETGSSRRWVVFGVLLALLVAALLGVRVLAGLAAVLAGAVVLGTGHVARRPALRKRAPAVGAALAVVGVLAVALAPPLAERLTGVSRAVSAGDWNRVLSGRLDGWRTALHMAAEHPLTGVGHGGYGPSFGAAKLALADEGVDFFGEPQTAVFANAHNEYLEVAAETGLPGLAALVFALWVLGWSVRRLPPEDRPLGWALVTALALLALVHFPFRLAAGAYPALPVLAWLLAPRSGDGGSDEIGETA